jgi:hypothetical protein
MERAVNFQVISRLLFIFSVIGISDISIGHKSSLVMGDILFSTIERWHQNRAWGRILDAGIVSPFVIYFYFFSFFSFFASAKTSLFLHIAYICKDISHFSLPFQGPFLRVFLRRRGDGINFIFIFAIIVCTIF